jgi:hypothetical protein
MKIKTFIPVVVGGLMMLGFARSGLAGNAAVAPTAPAAPSAPIAPSPLASSAPVAQQAPSAATAPSAPVPGQNVTNGPAYGNTNSVYWITNAPNGSPVAGYTNDTSYNPPMSQVK